MRTKSRPKRKKIIPDKLFSKLWSAAEKSEERHQYINYYTLVSSDGYIAFKKKYGIEYEESLALLGEIYDKQHMSFKEILETAGRRKADIANTFCVPIRTVEEWYSGRNKCSSYIRLMILRYYHMFDLGKYIYCEAEERYKASEPSVYEKREKPITDRKESGKAKKAEAAEEKDRLDDIDEILKTFERRNETRIIKEDPEVKRMLDKTSYLDRYLQRKRTEKI